MRRIRSGLTKYAEITDLLKACRDQRELERTADELNDLADEIEAEP